NLFIDGQPVVNCPAGEPYVPATHRPAAASRTVFKPATGPHRVRIELGSHDATQEATVLLAYANLHIAPWTSAEIPHPATLPDSAAAPAA
ncbi:MAG TPA: hypothetical protein VIO38_07910, partial [Rariglobus sp.]